MVQHRLFFIGTWLWDICRNKPALKNSACAERRPPPRVARARRSPSSRASGHPSHHRSGTAEQMKMRRITSTGFAIKNVKIKAARRMLSHLSYALADGFYRRNGWNRTHRGFYTFFRPSLEILPPPRLSFILKYKISTTTHIIYNIINITILSIRCTWSVI